MKTAFVAGSLALSQAKLDVPNGKCHALALSSGDEASAYQAGALQGLVNSDKLTAADVAYDTVSGVSGGALNAVLLLRRRRRLIHLDNRHNKVTL